MTKPDLSEPTRERNKELAKIVDEFLKRDLSSTIDSYFSEICREKLGDELSDKDSLDMVRSDNIFNLIEQIREEILEESDRIIHNRIKGFIE